MTNLFFDEDGAFKVGVELSSSTSSCQVELVSGKRIKVKKSHIFVTFTTPSCSEFMKQAQEMSETIDLDLLWEFAPEEDFSAKDIAKDYFGEEPTALQAAAMIMRLHANPVYFYRKGRGNYRKAPAETLRLALAAIERKKQQELLKDQYVHSLVNAKIAPEEIKSSAISLMVKPDKNSIEWKAVKEASDELGISPLRLLLQTKAIASPWVWHVDSFFSVNFPKGKEFSRNLATVIDNDYDALPLVDVQAFSIDDSNTTEVDDAISVTPMSGNRTCVGIHISAPALGISRDSALDIAARDRMSTVYAPGLKTTMLPEAWIKAFSLDEGKVSPVISLYAVVDNETLDVISTESRLERICVAKNLWYDKIESEVTEEAIQKGMLSVPFGAEIIWLWHFSKHLLNKREIKRGRPEAVGRIDWFFDLQGEGENARIMLKGRKRGAPLDLLVAEMMIFANSTWGAFLDEKKTVGIYRTQHMSRVKLTSVPGPHDGIGVDYYAWSTSPLRRYVDMVNQRQLIAVLKGEIPPYKQNDSDLFAVISAFDSTYTTFLDFQTRMDRYWSLRWLEQENIKDVKACVVKGDLVRIDGLPMAQRVPGLPELPRGQNVILEVLALDFVELVMECRLKQVLNESSELEEEIIDETEVEPKDSDMSDGTQEISESGN
ncbi:MAG: RNB domain-containing ribonuclease [Burkholderiaceae bacterium]|nr:RNB domain-containing ribonuclease [Burkholderiaceae bacterium]